MAPPADERGHDVRADPDPAADSDGALLRRIAERDRGAFELLYRRYAGSVYGLARRRVRSRGRAEEATRRAFVAIWRAAPTYVADEGHGARWVFTVARNAIVESGPESAVEEDWLAFRVHAAVAGLPERERVPLELACWGGRSRSEIADLLGLELGVVETRTRSALAHVAGRLEEL
jgi:RNA polymerase sigma-70 factor (ECF subfamily)